MSVLNLPRLHEAQVHTGSLFLWVGHFAKRAFPRWGSDTLWLEEGRTGAVLIVIFGNSSTEVCFLFIERIIRSLAQLLYREISFQSERSWGSILMVQKLRYSCSCMNSGAVSCVSFPPTPWEFRVSSPIIIQPCFLTLAMFLKKAFRCQKSSCGGKIAWGCVKYDGVHDLENQHEHAQTPPPPPLLFDKLKRLIPKTNRL